MYFELETFTKNCNRLHFKFSNLIILFLYTNLSDRFYFRLMDFELEIFKKNCDNLYFDVFLILCDRIYFSFKN